MRQPGKYKKIILALGLGLIILIGGTLGAYYYTLHKHAGQITDMLYLLSQLEPEEATELDDASPPAPAPAPAPPGEEAAGAAGAGIKEPPPAPGRTSPAPQGQAEIKPAPLPPEIQEKLQQDARLIRRIALKDQLYAMQIIGHFSAQELQTMYSLYQEGGASRTRLLELLREKLTEEEIKKIRAIAEKYKTLLK